MHALDDRRAEGVSLTVVHPIEDFVVGIAISLVQIEFFLNLRNEYTMIPVDVNIFLSTHS